MINDRNSKECRQRSLRARMASAERWARATDRAAQTAPARRGLRAKFEREVDPVSRRFSNVLPRQPGNSSFLWGGSDSNRRPRDYESPALTS
jgi:hypothetical protein